jgi:hypothetical protein
MSRYLILRPILVWLGSLLVASSLVYAMTSVVGRWHDVADLSQWIEVTALERYFLSLVLAAMGTFTVVLVTSWGRNVPSFIVRRALKTDFILGYRVGLLWMFLFLILLSFGTREVSLNSDFWRSGWAEFMAILGIVAAEHIVWRTWIYGILRQHLSTGIAFTLVVFCWVCERAIFFPPTQWLFWVGLILEGVTCLFLVHVLGTMGSLSFLLLWGFALHGLMGFSFMHIDMSGIFFVKFTLPAELGLERVKPELWERLWVVSILPYAAMAGSIILGCSLAPRLLRRLH